MQARKRVHKYIVLCALLGCDVEPLDSTDRTIYGGTETSEHAKTVFMAPPWPEIYRNDEERKHSLGDALAEYSDLLPGYEALGYEILVLPKVSVAERADFVLREAGLRP